MKVIDCTKAATQHFLENSEIINKKENNKRKIRKTQTYRSSVFLCLLRHDVVHVFLCRSVC